MPTNKKGYMARWKMEKKAEILFRLCRGFPVCQICGETHKNLTVHHELPLNGDRPNGSLARIVNWYENPLILRVLCVECHKKVHSNEKAHKIHEFGQMVLV